MFPENQVRTLMPPTEKGCWIWWSKATVAELHMASSHQGKEGKGHAGRPQSTEQGNKSWTPGGGDFIQVQ